MMDYTYDREFAAHMLGHPAFSEWPHNIVTVPDQVADDQTGFDGNEFPVLAADGTRLIVRLDGDAYDLHGTGTGDMVVRFVAPGDRIVAEVGATAEGLYASLREPTQRTFKRSARGLMAALDWLSETHRDRVVSLGNRAGVYSRLVVDGVEYRGWDLDDLQKEIQADDPDYAKRIYWRPRRSRTAGGGGMAGKARAMTRSVASRLREGDTLSALLQAQRAGFAVDQGNPVLDLLAIAYSVQHNPPLRDQLESLSEADAALRRFGNSVIDQLWRIGHADLDTADGLMVAEKAASRLHHYGARLSRGVARRLLREFRGEARPRLMLLLPSDGGRAYRKRTSS